jgi:hypothetical protein
MRQSQDKSSCDSEARKLAVDKLCGACAQIIKARVARANGMPKAWRRCGPMRGARRFENGSEGAAAANGFQHGEGKRQRL